MKQVIAVIKPWVVEAVIKSLQTVDFEEISVREVKGYGRQKNYLDQYRENEYSRAFVPKIELTIWCQDEQVEPIVERLTSVSRTGRLGDGKVMVLPVTCAKMIEINSNEPESD